MDNAKPAPCIHGAGFAHSDDPDNLFTFIHGKKRQVISACQGVIDEAENLCFIISKRLAHYFRDELGDLPDDHTGVLSIGLEYLHVHTLFDPGKPIKPERM